MLRSIKVYLSIMLGRGIMVIWWKVWWGRGFGFRRPVIYNKQILSGLNLKLNRYSRDSHLVRNLNIYNRNWLLRFRFLIIQNNHKQIIIIIILIILIILILILILIILIIILINHQLLHQNILHQNNWNRNNRRNFSYRIVIIIIIVIIIELIFVIWRLRWRN